MTIIKLTTIEREFLDQFQDGEWHLIWGWQVDYLACRGLLQREGRVTDRIRQPKPGNVTPGYRKAIEDHNRGVYSQRSTEHHYRLTRRGRKALGYASVIPNWDTEAIAS